MLDKAVLVHFDCTIWTGKAALGVSEQLPKNLYNAGSIKLYDTDYLKVFRNIKTRTSLCLSSYGIPFMAGYLVNSDRLPVLERELQDNHTDWTNRLAEFVSAYPERCVLWQKQSGKWASVIRGKQPAADEIASRFHFAWQTFRLMPCESSQGSGGNDTGSLMQSLPARAMEIMLQEIAALRSSFILSKTPGFKAYHALKRIANKADALGFVNPDVAALAPILMEVAGKHDNTLAKKILSSLYTQQDVKNMLRAKDLDSQPENLIGQAQVLLSSMAVLDNLGL